MDPEKSHTIQPRIIIHGGAGNITRDNLPPKVYDIYRKTLIDILHSAYDRLRLPGATALDIAAFAVSQLENNGMFNSGHGAVFTTEGTHELEASIMVSSGYQKRGVGLMNVTKAKNPILVAREMLIRGEDEDGGGAQGHVQLQGATVDRLAEKWGLETIEPSYFWTRKRWDEHRRGLGKNHDDNTYKRHKQRADGCSDSLDLWQSNECISTDTTGDTCSTNDPSWDGKEYLPQGTVGAVVLDSFGIVCCATSTGGLTNKLPGRIGDTPTIGAGFWAESWQYPHTVAPHSVRSSVMSSSRASLVTLLADCLPGVIEYMPLSSSPASNVKVVQKQRAVGMSGTGNGDSFLRLSAVRTAAAMARFKSGETSSTGTEHFPLQYAVTDVAGPGGMLQNSAEDRWHKTGEGEGGIIGIDLTDGKGTVVYDYNCGGIFHAWIDDDGQAKFQVFRDRVDTEKRS
jgi:L-asparaginase